MTVEDLMMIYDAAIGGARRMGHQHRIGVTAIVRALRDEIVPQYWKLTDLSTVSAHDLRRFFNSILGSDAGEKVAGGSTRKDGQSCNSSDGSSPATDAAPAVCVWTKEGHWYWQHGLCSGKSNLGGYCPACGKPIKFTEAK